MIIGKLKQRQGASFESFAGIFAHYTYIILVDKIGRLAKLRKGYYIDVRIDKFIKILDFFMT